MEIAQQRKVVDVSLNLYVRMCKFNQHAQLQLQIKFVFGRMVDVEPRYVMIYQIKRIAVL